MRSPCDLENDTGMHSSPSIVIPNWFVSQSCLVKRNFKFRKSREKKPILTQCTMPFDVKTIMNGAPQTF